MTRALAEHLAHHPEVVAALLVEHVDDGNGRCTVCSAGAQTGRSRFPCLLALVAREAEQHRLLARRAHP